MFHRLGARTWVPDFVFPDPEFRPLAAGGALRTQLKQWDSDDEAALYDLVLALLEKCAADAAHALIHTTGATDWEMELPAVHVIHICCHMHTIFVLHARVATVQQTSRCRQCCVRPCD